MDTYRLRKQIRRLPGKVIHKIPLPQPEISAGKGARAAIGAICSKCGYKHVLVVTDTTLHSLGFDKAIVASLEAAGIGYSVFSDIHSEPNIGIIDAGRKQAMACNAECIIALGGGSVMDSCKMIAAGVRMPHLSTRALLLKFLLVPKRTLPLIMVPSTAGTGAELTVGAVVSNARGVKGSTVLVGLHVTHVVHDSELTMHAPAHVTIACGIDALSHCIEGAVSDVRYNATDMQMSLEGTKLILHHLPILLSDPENNDSRLAMCRAAMFGGNAINTQLAGYVHAFAHSIGAKYHLSHGQAISLMLLPVMEFQKDACISRYAELARYCGLTGEASVLSLQMTDEQAAETFLQAIRELLHTCGVDKIPSPVKPEDYNELIAMVAADSINYSAPITMTNDDIKHILEQITEL